VEFFRQTLYHSNLHQTSPISQRLQTYSLPPAVCLICRTWAMDFLHFQVSALAYPLFQQQQVCLESADFQTVGFQTVDCQGLAQACLRYQQVFLELVGCQQVAYQALVPAYLRYRRVFHSPAVLGQVCPHYLPVYLSLAEYLLFQVLLTLFLGYLALVQACQLFQELADFQTAGCQASDLVCQRSQASDPVYLRCQQDFPLAVFPLVAFPLAVFPLAVFPLAVFPLAVFLLAAFLLEVSLDFQPADFPLAVFPLAVYLRCQQDFPLVDFQPAVFPLAVFPLAVFPLAVFPLATSQLAVFQLVAFLLEVSLDFQPVDFQLAAFQLAAFQLVAFLDFPTAVFLTAVFQLAVSPLLAQVFQLFQRQQTFCLELVGSQLVAFQRLVQDCRRVSQACRTLLYQRQQTL
jgi:hypothetical protein